MNDQASANEVNHYWSIIHSIHTGGQKENYIERS